MNRINAAVLWDAVDQRDMSWTDCHTRCCICITELLYLPIFFFFMCEKTHMKRKLLSGRCLFLSNVDHCPVIAGVLMRAYLSSNTRVCVCTQQTRKFSASMCVSLPGCEWVGGMVFVCNRSALLLSSPPLNRGASPLPAHQD